MHLIDERGRLFGLINLIDLAVVLLVLVVAAAAYLRIGGDELRHHQGSTRAKIEVEVSEVRQASVDAVEEGDIAVDHITGQVIGEVSSKEVEPYRTPVETAQGDVVMAEVPEYYTILLTLDSYGHYAGGTYSVATYDIKVGERITLEGPQFSLRATVLGFEVVE